LSVIEELIRKNNTVIVIEHNMLLARQADWLLDFGPGSGKYGGDILYEGIPEQISNAIESLTKEYLFG
ncbi:MAG: excinuclease ABC subunit A, partial [Vagococcus sp.]